MGGAHAGVKQRQGHGGRGKLLCKIARCLRMPAPRIKTAATVRWAPRSNLEHTGIQSSYTPAALGV